MEGLPPISKEELYNLFWVDLLDAETIAVQFKVGRKSIYQWMDYYAIPKRRENTYKINSVRIYKKSGEKSAYWSVRDIDKNRWIQEHRHIVENELKVPLKDTDVVHHLDGNSLNNHPTNLLVIDRALHTKCHEAINNGENIEGFEAPPWFYNHMIFAYVVASNSSCKRLKVGAVVTNFDLDTIYGFGYNGNAAGLANTCDSSEPGKCGCIHAESNALLKVRENDKNKILFVTHTPCLGCAKLIINSGFKYVYYGESYRDTSSLKILNYSGIRTCPYPLINRNSGNGFYFERVSPTGFIEPKIKLKIENNLAKKEEIRSCCST